jgi:hypothetical protein
MARMMMDYCLIGGAAVEKTLRTEGHGFAKMQLNAHASAALLKRDIGIVFVPITP